MIISIEIDYSKEFNPKLRRIGEDMGTNTKRKLLPSHIEFKPGLNIIVGSNGCGKSTLIMAIKMLSICGGYFGDNFDKNNDIEYLGLADWDFHTEPVDNNIDFTMDFRYPVFVMKEIKDMNGDEALKNFTTFGNLYLDRNSSRGESLTNQVISFLNTSAEKWQQIKDRYSIEDICRVIGRGKFDEQIKEYINKHHKELQPLLTVIMDEPDHGLDVFNIREMADLLKRLSKDAQTIVVLHNPLLIHILKDEANIIELTPNYIKEIESLF